MSRLGKLPINIPNKVTLTESSARLFLAQGPQGEVSIHLPKFVKVEQADSVIKITISELGSSKARAAWGLARQLVANAIKGVSEGFTKKLELSGIGFKVVLEGNTLVLNLGFSHPVRYNLPVGVKAVVEKNMFIAISGASKEQVGQVAAEIRLLKEPEPYKGKGIKYADEIIRRKAGKVVKSAGAK
ncbi:MAG: 50S ribosomal protein L6 [Patescibacteria group bacterium]